MLGLGDIWVALSFWLSIISTAVGVIYGIIYWNREGTLTDAELREESLWMKDEIEIDEEISGGSA
ncbi:MAG: symporter small accessory protein [Spirochaetota bacterium]